DRYQSGMLAMQAGAVGAGDMTTETTLVKLMHLLGNFPGKPESIRELLIVPLAGEISTPQ
nr:asparaginase [Calditrichia bacterium]